jgi:hypothetical protein
MGAVTSRGPVPTAAWDAFRAGHDIIMVAHDPLAQRESVELFRAMQASGELSAADLDASTGRIAALLRSPRDRRAPDPEAGRRLAADVAERAVNVLRWGSVPLPLPRDAARTLVLLPDFSQVRERFTFEGGPRGPEACVRRALKGLKHARLERAPVESGDVQRLRAAIREADRVIFFCFEAMRFPGQKAMAELINREAPERSVACLIRSSFDLGLLDRRVTAVDACGYRLCQLQAALRLMIEQPPL